MTEEHERLSGIAQAASSEIAKRILRTGRPASAVLLWLSAHKDTVVGIDVFGHPILLKDSLKRDPDIDDLLASPLQPSTIRAYAGRLASPEPMRCVSLLHRVDHTGTGALRNRSSRRPNRHSRWRPIHNDRRSCRRQMAAADTVGG